MMEGPALDPIYIYYKLFDEKGPLNIRDPICSNNPYIGRVDEKRGFGIDWENSDAYSTTLFETISGPKAFDLRESVSLLSTDRLGSSPQNPLVLKVVYIDMLEHGFQ
ncbi:hypothetical protein V8E52_009108 [Russula decolorans]